MPLPPHPLSVVVGDFDPVVRLGLACALRSDPGIEVVADDGDGRSLEAVVTLRRPLVVLVSAIDGRQTIGRLKASSPSAALVVLAAAPAMSYGWLLLAIGASCVAQSTSVEHLLDAIRVAGRGGRIFLAENGERAVREPSDATSLLTPRELIVLEHLSRGDSYTEIALAINAKVETVRKHTVSIRRKLNIGRRGELVGLLMSQSRG
jgi:DNA-binding NarL/FixJ family response regulator